MARLDQKRFFASSGRASSSNNSVVDDQTEDDDNSNAHLSPKEAFEKFDTDSSGDIDEDEFFHLLESVGLGDKKEGYQETLFKRYLKSGSKTIDYDGFKAAWLLLGNPRQELINRGRSKDIPKFATKHQLVRLLEKTLEEEERLDALAKAEADRYRKIQEKKNHREEYIQKAKNRAGLELAAALDAAGQVYVLGTGAHGQFCGKPKKDMGTSGYEQIGFDLLQSLWEERVEGKNHGANINTAGIWGRQPRKVVLTDNAVLALTDSGILSWGGASNWNEVSDNQPMQRTPHQLTQTTPRSSALLMNNERMHRKHMAVIQEEMNEKDAKAAHDVEEFKLVLQYYGSWPMHFDGTNDVDMVKEHLLESVSYDQLLQSLLFRGKPCEGNGLSKMELGYMLANDIKLETEMLGELGQKELCDMEHEITDLMKQKKSQLSKSLTLKFQDKWAPLLREQKRRAVAKEKRDAANRRSSRNKQKQDFEQWDQRRASGQNAPITEHLGLMAGSITARGSDIQTPRGVSQCLDIAAGSNHAGIIVKDQRSRGSLYTWGVSSLGRLGQGSGTQEVADSNYPTIVQELKGTYIVDISLGQSHSAAVSSGGALFLWGAGSSGQLGFGQMTDGKAYFCDIPTRLAIPYCKSIRKVSCGSCHTACVGKSGELYVWGSGDGGRLGLNISGTQETPALVDTLRHEKVRDVSCGTYTTLALTVSENLGCNNRRGVKKVTGGRLYVAGPKNVLGASFPTFGELECLKQKPLVIKCISAGYSHQSFVSDSGELYCWGLNLHGCCGQDVRTRFIPEPAKVESIYEAPKNMALNKPSRLSSLYMDSDGLSAYKGVDGNIDGKDIRGLAHTQFESNPYFEVDLGSFVHISNIRLWNRTDEPDDMAMPDDLYSRRLFPCIVMISQFPFPDDLEGKDGLETCLGQSVAKIRFTEDRRMSNWDVPKFTVGRYIRLQLEGTNFLHFAQLEVFGHEARTNGPVSSCIAGKFVTAAVVGGMDDRRGVEAAYKRAISADWYNAEVLRQFSAYSDEYRKECNSFDCKAKCLLCVGSEKCEICSLKAKFRTELEHVIDINEPYRLEDLANHLLSARNIESSINVERRYEALSSGSEVGKSPNVLPVLLKLKHRRSILRRKKESEPK